MKCFDDRGLARMREGRLPPEEAREASEHVAGCARCAARLEEDERRTLAGDERRTLAPEALFTPGPQPRPEEMPALGRGTPLDRYVVLDPLGEGGMGMVYAAYDSVLDRKVALKLLPPPSLEDGPEVGSGRARLRREAQAMARLSHPNVVAVYDVHEHGDQVFMAMELVEGQTLQQWLREKPRGKREILSAFLDAGRGLAAAHAAGLVHRDFKPANVLVGKDGRVRVTDFGLARPHNAPPEPDAPGEPIQPSSLLELDLTRKGAVMGTPAYMAPEQHRGATADARSDQFSFAVALWEALHGARPFDGHTPAERKENVLAGRLQPPPPQSRVPPWVNRALLRALHTQPEARYPSLGALLAILERDPAQLRRRRLLAAGLLLFLTGSGALTWTAWNQRGAKLCSGAPEKLTGVWDVPRQVSIEQAFLATGRPYARDTWARVREALGDYTRGWVDMHRETCEATRLRGEQSEAVMSLRMVCLEGRRQELAALTEVFTEADATVLEKAVSAASALRPLWGCADVEALLAEVKPPEDATTRQAVEAARSQLARVRALAEAGKLKEALGLATTVSRKTGTLGYKPVYAEALFLQGWARFLSGESQGVPELLSQAVWLAHASRHDTIATAASLRLMGYYSLQGPPEQADHWEEYARASLERLGEEGELRSILLNNRGMRLYQQGNFAEAYEAFDKAFAIAQAQLGPANAMTLRYASNSLAALGNLDRADESLRALENLIRLGETSLGPLHPFLGNPLMNLSARYAMQGRLIDARRCLDRVHEIGQQAYSPLSEEWAQYHLSHGDLDYAEGEDASALEHYEKALRIHQELTGPESPSTLQAMVSVAQSRLVLQRLTLAQQTFQQVLELARKDPGRHGQVYTQALLGLADIHRARGQHDKALKLRQQALEQREQQLGPEHLNTSFARLVIADTHLDLGQPARALALYEQVLALFEKTMDLDSPTGLLPLAGKGDALQRLGRSAEALPLLERVLRVIETHHVRPEYQAMVKFALARALWDTGQGERATRLATEARATYARAPILYAHPLAELDALLARHAPGSLATTPTP